MIEDRRDREGSASPFEFGMGWALGCAVVLAVLEAIAFSGWDERPGTLLAKAALVGSVFAAGFCHRMGQARRLRRGAGRETAVLTRKGPHQDD